jgi:hypothetical protein
MKTLTFVIAMLFFLTACGDEQSVKERKMIVIAQHYPSYASCGVTMDALLNATIFDDTIAYEPEEVVTCSTFGRDEDNNDIKKSCFVKDFQSDTNDTCVIGVNYTDYAGDVSDLLNKLTDTVKGSKK